MMEWKTIDSAPKDGTLILLAVKTVPVLIGWWHDSVDGDPDWFTDDGEHLTGDMTPTHWMPLPDDPAD